MPTLYIANTSKQKHDFIYRIPEETSIRRQQIQPGSQIVVYQPGASLDVLRAIVDQHSVYGLIDVAEIDRRKPFVGICFRFDKAINVEKIMQADEHNSDVLTRESQETRKLSAAALHSAIERATEGQVRIDNLQLEVVQQNGNSEPGLNETVTVSREENPAPRGRGRPRKVV
jgi:hypothetical protein